MFRLLPQGFLTLPDRRGSGKREMQLAVAICVAIAAWAGTASNVVNAGEPGAVLPGAVLIVVSPAVEIDATETSWFLRVGGSSTALPPQSYFEVKGLPPSVTLSESERTASGVWKVPLSALDNLVIAVPPGFSGSTDVILTLFDGRGAPMAERTIEVYAKLPIAAPNNAPAPAPQPVATPSGTASNVVEAARPSAVEIVVSPSVEIDATETSWFLRVSGPSGALRPQSYFQVAGLPPSVTLSESERTASGAWKVPLSALENLLIVTPLGFSGSVDVVLTLFDGTGTAVAERTVEIYAKSAIAASSSAPAPQPAPIATGSLPPVPPPAAPPSRRAPTAQELAQAERLLALGMRHQGQGNIAIARQYFARAADQGLSAAALRMGETYDPDELQRTGVQGVKPDPAVARDWYRRAAEQGAQEAEARLKRLGSR